MAEQERRKLGIGGRCRSEPMPVPVSVDSDTHRLRSEQAIGGQLGGL